MTANRSMSSGIPMDEFYLQVIVKQIQLPQFNNLRFRVAVCSGTKKANPGLRTLDCTRDSYSWSRGSGNFQKCMLNFQVPCHTMNKHNYLLRVLQADDLEEVISINLNLKLIATEFLFHNISCFERSEQLNCGTIISFSTYIQKSRVLLLKEVLKHGESTEKLPVVDKKYLDFEEHLRQVKDSKLVAKAKSNNLNKIVEDGKSLTSKTSTKSNRQHPVTQTEKLPTNQDSQSLLKQVESPLVKILKGKINMTQSVHDAQRREQLIKHSKSQKILIKRTDSIDQDEEIKQKKNVKLFFIILLVLILGFLIGSKWKKTVKHKSRKRK